MKQKGKKSKKGGGRRSGPARSAHRAKPGRQPAAVDPAFEAFQQGVEIVRSKPIFSYLLGYAHLYRAGGNACPPEGWARCSNDGTIHVNAFRRGEPEEWAYVMAHCLLHLGYGHFQQREDPMLWNMACDCFVASFLSNLKLGAVPDDMNGAAEVSSGSEESFYKRLREMDEVPESFKNRGTAGPNTGDMILEERKLLTSSWHADWETLFSHGIADAVSDAVEVAAGAPGGRGAAFRLNPAGGSAESGAQKSQASRARDWFISSYPLLGSLAAGFRLIEDNLVCTRMKVHIAAVDPELQEIYINPLATLDEEQCRFIIAHELLHVGLAHHGRRQGRDAFLWNVACDYLINAWLMEMRIGAMPPLGVLFDSALRGLSAEAIYDRIVSERRRYSRLATFRGAGLGDILEGSRPNWWEVGKGVDLDEFCRRSLSQGLEYHESQGRGFLPAGLVEEIRALDQPPIPWDVQLARWFDEHFEPLHKTRTYARLSRRQSATPDIPRPQWTTSYGAYDGRTFGVILDTSGSMDRNLLAKALGTIASYSESRDVPLVRVLFCDAAVYDQGFMAPEEVAGKVKIRGRGGTILQPAVDLLEKDENFPKDGPLLVITDGDCDRLRIKRDHAFVLPRGHHLPFPPRGKIFYVE